MTRRGALRAMSFRHTPGTCLALLPRVLVGYSRRLDVTRFAVLGVGALLGRTADEVTLLVHEAIPERSRLELALGVALVERVRSRADGTYVLACRLQRRAA